VNLKSRRNNDKFGVVVIVGLRFGAGIAANTGVRETEPVRRRSCIDDNDVRRQSPSFADGRRDDRGEYGRRIPGDRGVCLRAHRTAVVRTLICAGLGRHRRRLRSRHKRATTPSVLRNNISVSQTFSSFSGRPSPPTPPPRPRNIRRQSSDRYRRRRRHRRSYRRRCRSLPLPNLTTFAYTFEKSLSAPANGSHWPKNENRSRIRSVFDRWPSVLSVFRQTIYRILHTLI